MPNNFKLTGDYYVSKFGNDSWSGTSPDAPKRTIQAALNLVTSGARTIIIGSGVYNETISKSLNISITSITMLADGQVIIDGSLGKSASFIASTNSFNTWTFTNIQFTNFIDYAPIIFGINGMTVILNNCSFINCIIKSNRISNSPQDFYFTNCFLLSVDYSTFSSTSSGLDTNFIIKSSVIVNSIIGSSAQTIKVTTMQNCYVNSSTLIITKSDISALNFNYNNIQGSIVMSVASSVTSGVIQDTFSRYYDLSLAGNGGSGSLAEPYKRGDTLAKPFNFSNHRIAYPTMNASSSAVDPKFNSVEDQDFTLQADSWHIGRASDGTNIGGTKYALRRAANISFSGSSATVDPSLIFQYNNYVISGSEVTGSITSAPIAVSPLSSSKVIQKVTYNGLLAFNKDTGSASGSNQNVPDFDTFTSASGNAAANPDRLVYYMRHTTGSSIPVADAGWDNGGLWTAGEYNCFEWNTKPSIDNLGVGNGSGSFNAAATPTYIQATYVQMRVKLRNDYLL